MPQRNSPAAKGVPVSLPDVPAPTSARRRVTHETVEVSLSDALQPAPATFPLRRRKGQQPRSTATKKAGITPGPYIFLAASPHTMRGDGLDRNRAAANLAAYEGPNLAPIFPLLLGTATAAH